MCTPQSSGPPRTMVYWQWQMSTSPLHPSKLTGSLQARGLDLNNSMLSLSCSNCRVSQPCKRCHTNYICQKVLSLISKKVTCSLWILPVVPSVVGPKLDGVRYTNSYVGCIDRNLQRCERGKLRLKRRQTTEKKMPLSRTTL